MELLLLNAAFDIPNNKINVNLIIEIQHVTHISIKDFLLFNNV